MNKTPIQWTEFTSNPFMAIDRRNGKRGWFCTLADPSCIGCYAKYLNMSPRGFGNGLDFIPSNEQYVDWQINWAEIGNILRRQKPGMLFAFDMIDLFHPTISDDMIDVIFAVAALKPNITFQFLTKRIARAKTYLNDQRPGSGGEYTSGVIRDYAGRPGRFMPNVDGLPWDRSTADFRWPLPNVWVGTSCGRQKEANERIPDLVETHAAVRFISQEPSLELVDFSKWIPAGGISWQCQGCRGLFAGRLQQTCPTCGKVGYWSGSHNGNGNIGPFPRQTGQAIHQIIVGGMSGPMAAKYPFDPDWARRTISDCKAANVACFVKQMGANPVGMKLKHSHGGDMTEWPEDLRIREFPAIPR